MENVTDTEEFAAGKSMGDALSAAAGKLTEAERLMIELIAAQNAGVPAPAFDMELWPAVLSELQQQTIAGYPASAVSSLPLTKAQLNHYLGIVGSGLSGWFDLMRAQDSLLAVFRAEGVPVMILKGATASSLYPKPTSRVMGDIDLIVKPEDFGRAYDLIANQGWVAKETAGETADGTASETASETAINPRHIDTPQHAENPRHIGFKKDGAPVIELHHYYSHNKTDVGGEALDKRVFDAIDHVHWTDVNGFSIPLPDPCTLGLILLFHIRLHLRGDLGFRQVLDWLCYVETYLSDEFWEAEFREAARATGLEKLACAITALCKRYLGLQRQITWCDGGIADVRSDGTSADVRSDGASTDVRSDGTSADVVELLLVKISRTGNFGYKSKATARPTQSVAAEMKSPARLIRYLYQAGCSHWEPAQRHAWLAPAAVAYQIGYFARRGIENKVQIRTLVDDRKEAHVHEDLLKLLDS